MIREGFFEGRATLHFSESATLREQRSRASEWDEFRAAYIRLSAARRGKCHSQEQKRETRWEAAPNEVYEVHGEPPRIELADLGAQGNTRVWQLGGQELVARR
jgi:hypothetical protein